VGCWVVGLLVLPFWTICLPELILEESLDNLSTILWLPELILEESLDNLSTILWLPELILEESLDNLSTILWLPELILEESLDNCSTILWLPELILEESLDIIYNLLMKHLTIWLIDWFIHSVERHIQQCFIYLYIMATSFSGGRSRSIRREPSTMGKQLVNFITCGCESNAPFFVIYTLPTT
jgi:hypothetical protein